MLFDNRQVNQQNYIMSSIDKEALRVTALADSETFKNIKRHGFFSVPISTAIGDDGPYQTRIHLRNQMGKPVTSPRNFQTSPNKTGQANSCFFGPLNSLATSPVKDQYIEVPKRLLHEQNSLRKIAKKQRSFYPASCHKILIKASCQYKEETNPEKDPKRFKKEDGRIRTRPRNAYTNIQSTVLSSYFKPIKNVSDPLQRKHDIEWERQKAQKAKEAEIPFSPNKFRSDSFNPSKNVYEDWEFKKTSSPFKETQYNKFNHERRWRVVNRNIDGQYGYLAPFPRYIEDPLRFAQRQPKKDQTKDVFKAMNATTCIIPSASITQHPINMKKLLHHSFSHRF